jgi:hypothetical protein
MKSEYLQGHLSTLPRGFWPTKVFFTTYCGKCTIKVKKSKEVSIQPDQYALSSATVPLMSHPKLGKKKTTAHNPLQSKNLNA